MEARSRGGGLRRRMQERSWRRLGLGASPALAAREIVVGAITRTYWVAPRPAGVAGPAPLLLVLHGGGGRGPGMAAMSALDRRGPAAGFVTVFPDGVGRVWNDARDAPALGRRRNVDDVTFLRALLDTLSADESARPDRVYLAGMSNGALMSEHLARQGLLPVAGVALVSGPGTQTSRRAAPRPVRPASVVVFSGTHDPLVPYAGGPIGRLGRMVQGRRGSGDRGLVVAAEDVARDWAAGNGVDGPPRIEPVPARGGLPVTRMAWWSEGRLPVVLYRVEGGGHAWPGGAPYLPERFIGATTPTLDATGILLEQFRAREATGA
ncbi:MAG: hypothetical protein JOZ99_02785 [Actinobacteria bacterium]|nr:hypothetical protein [Actinomycetota bacterium]